MLVDRIKKYENATVVLLAHTWKSIPSENFSTQLYSSDLTVFIIGWAFWVEESMITPYVDKKISFWNQTMPHWLVKVVLLEQIRRWRTIKTGKKYHY